MQRMRNPVTLAVLLVIIHLGAISCKKNTNSTTSSSVSLSSSTVKRGEPLIAIANGLSSVSSVKWTVHPSTNTWVSSQNNEASIIFADAGSYILTATYLTGADSAAYDSVSSPVQVTDSVYADSLKPVCNVVALVAFDSSELVTLTPISYTDTGLVLLAHTQNQYANTPFISYLNPVLDFPGEYQFIFQGVVEHPCNPSTGKAQAIGILSFSGLTPGSSTVLISMLGATYQGTLTVTDASCTFSWNYSSRIIISPLQIVKQ
jgi:hypothetical protein